MTIIWHSSKYLDPTEIIRLQSLFHSKTDFIQLYYLEELSSYFGGSFRLFFYKFSSLIVVLYLTNSKTW